VGSLTERQKAIIIGCLLGDGSMRCKDNALLEINHSFKQKAYVDWKYEQLKRIVPTAPKKRFGNKDRIAYRFTTKSIPELTGIYKRFYTRRKKVIPDDLIITDLSLAIWLMDDGSKSYRTVYFNTQKFDMRDQRKLIKLLGSQHAIKAKVNKDKEYWRLRVAVESVGRLSKIVKPHILPCLIYKLPL
jgi:hypothetical protein